MSGATTKPVGFIGLGNIGAPMASRLVDWPAGLLVFDVRDEATAPFVEQGATAVDSPGALAEQAAVICIVVQNEEQVREVLSGPEGILGRAAPGTVVTVHSTISAEGAEALAELCADQGVDIVDAPVSGGAMGAHAGTLAVMAGGTEAAIDAARPVLERMATMVQHMGPVGAGTRTKIARNLITFVSYAAAGEAQRIAEAAGLDLVKLGEVVRHSDQITGGPGAPMVRDTTAVLAPDDGLRALFEHSVTLGEKDLALACELAEQLGVAAPFSALATRWLAPMFGLVEPPTDEAPA